VWKKAGSFDRDGYRVVPTRSELEQPSRRCTMADELRRGLERLLRKAEVEHDADFPLGRALEY
jgi:hypothetical protein